MLSAAVKVGVLAKATGMSVRTLHYYDHIGLLEPSHYTAAGHRLYGTDDIVRLQRIKSLQRLGFSLSEIRQCLERPEFSLERVITLHIGRLKEQIALQQLLCSRLEALAARLAVQSGVSIEEYMGILEAITMSEKYYTPEQVEQIRERGRAVGEDHIREVEAEWPQLMAAVQSAMDRGVDPASDEVQPLAKRWMELVAEFTGGDAGISRAVATMWQEEETIHGIDTANMRRLMAYINRALTDHAAE